MEGDFVCLGAHTCGVVGPGFVEEEEVDDGGCEDHEWEEEVEGEESCEGGIVYREASSDPLY